MKKSKGPVVSVSVDESLEQMRSALVAEGYILPTRTEELTDDELSLYGQGKPQSFAFLERNTKARSTRHIANTPDETIQQSMAMAARNGQQISENVWIRMQTDRLSVENGIKSDE